MLQMASHDSENQIDRYKVYGILWGDKGLRKKTICVRYNENDLYFVIDDCVL